MPQLHSVFLGCGPRAKRHAEGYAHVRSITPVAAADLNADSLSAFADRFNIQERHTDYQRMLQACKPAVVHCVTQPNFRLEPVRIAAAMGVKGIIVEKPLANTLTEARAIKQVADETGIKVVVNTQRRYYRSWQAFLQVAHSPQAGRIRFIRVHTNPSISCVGSHFIDLVQSLMGDVLPVNIWAAACDGEDYHTNHPGPASLMGRLIYPDRTVAQVEFSKHGVGVAGCPAFWMSTGIDVITDQGRLWWTESNGWGHILDGQPRFEAPTDFSQDDAAGQGAFTEALGAWINDPAQPHANRIEVALAIFEIVTALVQSAATGRRVQFGREPLVDAWDDLRQKLIAREGDDASRVDWRTCVDMAASQPALAKAGA